MAGFNASSEICLVVYFVALFLFRQKGAGYEAVLSVNLRGFLFLMVGGIFSAKMNSTNMYFSEKLASNHRKYKASKFYKLLKILYFKNPEHILLFIIV